MVHAEPLSGSRLRGYNPLYEAIPPSAVRVIGAEPITVRRCLSVGEPEPSSARREMPRPAAVEPPSERLIGMPCIVAGGAPLAAAAATVAPPTVAPAASPVEAPVQELAPESLAHPPEHPRLSLAPPDIAHFCVPPQADEAEPLFLVAPTEVLTNEASPWPWRLLLLAAFVIGLLLTITLRLTLSPPAHCP
jgi:hypothetical protein